LDNACGGAGARNPVKGKGGATKNVVLAKDVPKTKSNSAGGDHTSGQRRKS